jgi:hypothetical protein
MDEQKSELNKAIELLHKLIVLAQRDRKLPRYMARLFDDPEQYQKALEQIKWGLGQTAPEQLVPLPTFANTLSSKEWQSLYLGIVHSSLVSEAFKLDEDPASGVTADQMSVLSELADITPDPQSMFYTQDGAFMGVLESLRPSPVLDINQQLADGLEKFLILYDEHPDIAEMLYDLALSSDWQVVLASLKDRRDYTETGTSAAGGILKDWNAKLTPKLHSMLFGPTHISRAPKDLVQLAWEGSYLLEQAKNSVKPALRSEEQASRKLVAVDAAASRKLVAAASLKLFRESYAEQLDKVQSNLRLRAHAAQHFIGVRKFAKLDAFVYTWPEIAKLSMANYRSLEYVEGCLVGRRLTPSDMELDANHARDLFKLCAGDEQLIRFLQLRPHFREIDENELIQYKPIAPVIVETPQATGSPTAGMPPTSDVPKSTFIPTPRPYLSYHIEIHKKTPVNAQVGETPPSISTHTVTSSFSDRHTSYTDIALSVPDLLREMLALIGVTSEESLPAYLKDLFTSSSVNAPALLLRAGTHLLNTIFGSSDMKVILALALDEAMRSESHLRVIIVTEDAELFYLPWEWLPRPNQSEIFILSPQFSIVRSSPTIGRPSSPPRPLIPPLKVLAVMPRPADLPMLDLERARKNLESLESWSGGQVALSTFGDDAVTVDKLRKVLKIVQPHILHFEGHAALLEERLEPVLFFESDAGHAYLLELRIFAELIIDVGVQLVVFGNNDASAFYQNPMAQAAAILVGSGLPAAIAPMRGVDDATSTGFTLDFYRAFLQGHTLEDAIGDARRKLFSRGGDWSAFALFANPRALDFFYPLSRPQ